MFNRHFLYLFFLVSIFLNIPAVWATGYDVYDPALTVEGSRATVSFTVGSVQTDLDYDTLIMYWEGSVNGFPFNRNSTVCPGDELAQGDKSNCTTIDYLLKNNYRIKTLNLYPGGNNAIVVLERETTK